MHPKMDASKNGSPKIGGAQRVRGRRARRCGQHALTLSSPLPLPELVALLTQLHNPVQINNTINDLNNDKRLLKRICTPSALPAPWPHHAPPAATDKWPHHATPAATDKLGRLGFRTRVYGLGLAISGLGCRFRV